MSASPSPRVDPAAAVELVSLVQQQVGRLIQEHEPGATTPPNVAYQLADALESLLQGLRGDRPASTHRELDADAVEQVRWSVRVGRRLDMTEAFNRLNPQFGVRAEHGCWDAAPEQRARRAAVRRRELELSMGGRFARMLVPAEDGGGRVSAVIAPYQLIGIPSVVGTVIKRICGGWGWLHRDGTGSVRSVPLPVGQDGEPVGFATEADARCSLLAYHFQLGIPAAPHRQGGEVR